MSTTPGLIPARAGNTLEGVQAGEHFGAHPRSRGEHRRRAHPCRA